MFKPIPKTWNIVKLLTVCSVKTGKVDANHATCNGQYSFFTCALEPMKSDTYSFNGDLIILPGNGANVGHVSFYQGKIEAYQRTYVLHDFEIVSKFVYFELLHNWKKVNQEKQFGSATNYIKMGNFEEYSLAIPPLAEQKVIADKLDILLAQLEKTKARLERIPDILKRFRQSVLADAVRGKLTKEWRLRTLENNWKKAKLEDLVFASANGLSKRQGSKGTDVTILRLADFKDASRIFGNERQIKLDEKEVAKYSLENGDILVIRVNGSVDLAGRFIEYIPTKVVEGFCDHFIRLRLHTNLILPAYLTFIANEGEGRRYLQDHLSTSAGQNTINQKSIRGLVVPLPSKTEQIEIVHRVKQLFTYADTIEQRVQTALSRVNNLTQSILAKAFSGELTAEWRAANPDLIRGDNSAEALLAKITAEREALDKQPKIRKQAVKKETGTKMSKQILKVIDALKAAGKPLSGQELLAAAGYPSDSNTERLEQFFLDLRDALDVKLIIKQSRDAEGQDWFALAE